MIFVGHLIIIQQSMNKKTNKRFHRDLRMLLKPADTVSYSGNRLYLFVSPFHNHRNVYLGATTTGWPVTVLRFLNCEDGDLHVCGSPS